MLRSALGLLVCALGCQDGATSLPDASLDAAMAVPDVGDADTLVDGGAELDAGVELDLDTYLDEFFDGICDWFTRCEPKLGVVAFGQTLCHPFQRAQTIANFTALVEGGGAELDASLAASCLSEIAGAECNVAALDLGRCDAAFLPLRVIGDSCMQDLECAGGRCAMGATCPGSCVALATAGQPCGRATDCGADLTCIGGMCATPHTTDQPCERRTDCAFPMTCRLSGTCGAPPSGGEACSSGLGGDLCGGSLVCLERGGERVCGEGAAPTQACSSAMPCAPGGRCVEGACVATAVAGTTCEVAGCVTLHACTPAGCQPLPTAGQECTAMTPCVQGACVGGRCELLDAGATCDPADAPQFGECDGFCSGSECRSGQPEGGTCRGSSQCAEGLECREAGGPATCLPRCR